MYLRRIPVLPVNVDRKAANYTICECAMVSDTPDFYMAANEGEASALIQGSVTSISGLRHLSRP